MFNAISKLRQAKYGWEIRAEEAAEEKKKETETAKDSEQTAGSN
jgi:hypothetical protein